MATQRHFPNLQIADHPLIQHKLTLLRRKDTPKSVFRQLLREISLLMGYEITRQLPMRKTRIQTPVAATEALVLAGRKPAIVCILRAGLGMGEGLKELMPSAREGHIGIYRDEATKEAVQYYVKLPEHRGRLFFLVDPMLATGHSAVRALDILNEHGVSDQNIRFMALVVAPEGMQAIADTHPDVRVYAAALDQGLDDNAYIVPGLGDAGDRIFGTK